MPRYVAFLRGISPLNARMADLRLSFEQAGFSQVKSVTTRTWETVRKCANA